MARFFFLLGSVLLMPGFLWAQENSIVIWFDKQSMFDEFSKIEEIEKPFAVWIDTSFEVKLTRHPKTEKKLMKEKALGKEGSVSVSKLQDVFKPTFLLYIRPLSASEKILSGEIELYTKGNSQPRIKPFGADTVDLAQTISRKVTEIFQEQLPPKRRIFGMSRTTFGYSAQAAIVVGAIVWTIVAHNDTLPKLPAPKSLPGRP